jgi:uncharacterized damage-inducible protein DinB
MEDLKTAARLLRWLMENLVHNLTFIPEDRLHWKPEPGAKSALEIAGEVIGGQRMMLPVFHGGDWSPQPHPQPKTLEEARSLLLETAAEYAAALESAERAQMDRIVPVFTFPVWAPRAVLLPVVDAIHHHGQVTYIQTLLGDGESHFDMEAAARFFARPES